MNTPAWIAATSGQRPQASQVNQFLGAHATNFIYTGSLLGSSATTNGLYAHSTTWNAQSFTPGANWSVGRIVLNLYVSVPPPPSPLTISIQTNSGSAPSGTTLVSTQLAPDALTNAATPTSIPMPCALTSGTTYWIVTNIPTGAGGNYFGWAETTATSGASTSTNGASWTAQPYGLLYGIYSSAATPPLVHTYGDAGARWATWTWSGAQPNAVQEWTQGQTASGYLYSSRTLSYSGTALTSVA